MSSGCERRKVDVGGGKDGSRTGRVLREKTYAESYRRNVQNTEVRAEEVVAAAAMVSIDSLQCL